MERELVWRTYTAAETLLMTRRVEIIDKKEFAVAALNADDQAFVVHVPALAQRMTMPIYPSCQAQVATLTSKKTGILWVFRLFQRLFFRLRGGATKAYRN